MVKRQSIVTFHIVQIGSVDMREAGRGCAEIPIQLLAAWLPAIVQGLQHLSHENALVAPLGRALAQEPLHREHAEQDHRKMIKNMLGH